MTNRVEYVTIRGQDSILTQCSLVSMLENANKAKVPIGKLSLIDVVSSIGEDKLTLKHKLDPHHKLDLYSGVLSTVEVLDITQWDCTLNVDDYRNVINVLGKCRSLNEARMEFPSPPPAVCDKFSLRTLRDVKFVWFTGHIRHTMGNETGIWSVNFGRLKDNQTVYPEYSLPGPNRGLLPSGGNPRRDYFEEIPANSRDQQNMELKSSSPTKAKRRKVSNGSPSSSRNRGQPDYRLIHMLDEVPDDTLSSVADKLGERWRQFASRS